MDWKPIYEEAAKAEGGTPNMAFIAGCCLGIATNDSNKLSMEDRIYIAKAGEYLRRIVFNGTSELPKETDNGEKAD